MDLFGYLEERLSPPLSTEKATGPFVDSVNILRSSDFRDRVATHYDAVLYGGPPAKLSRTEEQPASKCSGADLFLQSLFG